ncbi:hypothetical protein PMG11_08798 [Penicillium brasilianum]|uniref:Uncharacterized protein n=1 Tax=Penicillium brasilianum TaxID=104259 RepID=A0A0F7TXV4_PENBI|nr:hypothetical protein PMG11_08798 [Penicillium brasilianum]
MKFDILFNIKICLVLTLALRSCSAQGPAAAKHCHSEWIQTNDLKNCNCDEGSSTTCQECDLGNCNGIALTSTSKLKKPHCYEGCTEANWGCDSCFLWFKSVCNSVQKGIQSGKYKPSPSGLWIRLNEELLSTTQRTPGILELTSEEPWDWGQTLYDRGTQALVINSVKTRKQEQIHFHICDGKQQPGDPKFILGALNYAKFQQKPIKVPGHPNWLCRVESAKDTPISGVTADIRTQTATGGPCSKLVGAAVLVDSHDRTWMCLTTGIGSTQGIFCK